MKNKKETEASAYFNGYIKKKVEITTIGKEFWTYARVSTKMQMETNSSIQNQKENLIKAIAKIGGVLTKEFGGGYESAKDDKKRVEFNKLINEIKHSKRKPFGIMVNDISRFSRTGGSANGIIDSLKKMGIYVFCASTGENTITERGEYATYQNSLNAYGENLRKKEIIIPNIKTFINNGNRLGRVPLGYDHFGPRVKNPHKVQGFQEILINKEGEILRKGFELKLTGRYSDVQIIKKLEALGLKIRPQKLSKIWRNPFYCGVSISSFIETPVIGNWEPLISQVDFKKIQKILENNPSGFQHNSIDTTKILGAKFSKCSECNGTITAYLNKKKNIYYYKCPNCNINANAVTTKNSKTKGLINLFVSHLKSYTIPEPLLKLIKMQIEKSFVDLNKANHQNQKELELALKTANRQIQEIKIEWGLNKKPEEICKLAIAKLEDDIFNINQQLDSLPSIKSNLEEKINKAIDNLQNIDALWLSLKYEGQRLLQQTLFPNGLTIDLKNREFLTSEINTFFSLIKTLSISYSENKMGINQSETDLSPIVARPGFEPGTSGL